MKATVILVTTKKAMQLSLATTRSSQTARNTPQRPSSNLESSLEGILLEAP